MLQRAVYTAQNELLKRTTTGCLKSAWSSLEALCDFLFNALTTFTDFSCYVSFKQHILEATDKSYDWIFPDNI